MAISPQLPEKSRELIEKHKLKFEILSDEKNSVARAYGLAWELPDDLKNLYLQGGVDLEASNGEDSWTLPMPARYIIDQDSTVRYARVAPDHTHRPEPDETLEALKKISG